MIADCSRADPPAPGQVLRVSNVAPVQQVLLFRLSVSTDMKDARPVVY